MLATHAIKEGVIATLTIRDLDDEIRSKLRVRAARKGTSMEAEVRVILADAVKNEPAVDDQSAVPGAWYRRMRERLADTNGYWDDEFVEYVNSLRRMDPVVSFEQWRQQRAASGFADESTS